MGAIVHAEELQNQDSAARLMDEVRSGSGYISQGDLRLHFGAATADLEIHWPSGQVDRVGGVKANQVVTVTEGKATPEATG